MKTNKIKIILEHDDVRMVDIIDCLDNHTYHIDLYFKNDKTWHTIRSGSFYYCHELYKLLIRGW